MRTTQEKSQLLARQLRDHQETTSQYKMEMNFFDTAEPYEIANNMTGHHELAPDLVAHVYLIMQSKDNIENERSFFITCCSKQWRFKNSEFNRQFRPVFTSEFNDEQFEHDETIIHNDKFKQFLNEYLLETPPTIEAWYVREVAILWMDGMTYREISKATTINIRYITEAIKQFKHDVLHSFNSRIDKHDTDEL